MRSQWGGPCGGGEPLNGISEIGGPEQFRLDELVRKALAAKGDPREVVADEQARYSGARISERTLVQGPGAQLGGDHLRQVARPAVSAGR